MRLHEFAKGFHVVTDRQHRAGIHVEFAQRRVPFGPAGRQRLAPDIVGLLRQVEDGLPAFGRFGRQLDVLGPQRG